MFGVEALCCLVDVSAFCARKRWRRQNRRCIQVSGSTSVLLRR
jgi:hypothetical protein